MKPLFLAGLLPLSALLIVAAVAAVVVVQGDDSKPAQSSPADAVTPKSEPRLAPESSVCQGILHVPDPGSPRTFPAEYTQIREVDGLSIVANANVDPAALDNAESTIQRIFAKNDLEKTLAEDGAYVIVADRDQGVLDLPEFRCLDSSSNQAFFSHVCGVADRADYPVVTVNELDLLGDADGPCDGLNILYHELGHLVQGWALNPADYFDIRQYYQDAVGSGKYRGEYASTNANEYFAEATQAYFLTADVEGRHNWLWLQQYDPQIFELLKAIYGG
ncbi:MAG: hypothetical protein AB7J35_18095 [Dehalococcoidia bacterium]